MFFKVYYIKMKAFVATSRASIVHIQTEILNYAKLHLCRHKIEIKSLLLCFRLGIVTYQQLSLIEVTRQN